MCYYRAQSEKCWWVTYFTDVNIYYAYISCSIPVFNYYKVYIMHVVAYENKLNNLSNLSKECCIVHSMFQQWFISFRKI